MNCVCAYVCVYVRLGMCNKSLKKHSGDQHRAGEMALLEKCYPQSMSSDPLYSHERLATTVLRYPMPVSCLHSHTHTHIDNKISHKYSCLMLDSYELKKKTQHSSCSSNIFKKLLENNISIITFSCMCECASHVY